MKKVTNQNNKTGKMRDVAVPLRALNIIFMFCFPVINAEQSKLSIDIENRNRTEMQVNSFDEYNPDYWQFEDSENNNPEYGFINPIQSNDIVLEGEGALKFEYSIHNIEPWGGM